MDNRDVPKSFSVKSLHVLSGSSSHGSNTCMHRSTCKSKVTLMNVRVNNGLSVSVSPATNHLVQGVQSVTMHSSTACLLEIPRNRGKKIGDAADLLSYTVRHTAL